MDYLGIDTVTYNTGITQYPLLRRVKETLTKNRIKINQYYKEYSRTINNDHFFIKLIYSCYGYFGDTVEDTYYNLKFNYRDLAQQLNMVSASTAKKPQAVFYGKDYLIGVDSFYRLNEEVIEPSFIGGQLSHLTSYRPIMMLYHEHYSLQPDLLDHDITDSYSVSLINLPLFGAMLHQWYKLNEKNELPEPLSHFLTEYIYTPILDDIIDISFFNRLKQCIKLGNEVYLDTSIIDTDNNRIMNSYLVSINDLVNQLVVSIAETLSKDVFSVGEILHRIPGLIKKDMRDLYPLYDNGGLTAMEWPNALVQGWLVTQTNMVVNQLDRSVVESNLRMYAKNLNRSKRNALKLVLNKKDREWFDSLTEL